MAAFDATTAYGTHNNDVKIALGDYIYQYLTHVLAVVHTLVYHTRTISDLESWTSGYKLIVVWQLFK